MRGVPLLADRLCVGLLFVLFVCGGCENFQKEEQELIYVTATVLNLRDKPTTKSNVVGRLKRGQELVVVEKGDPWLQVKIDDETMGWVHGNYVGDPSAVRAVLQKELAQQRSSTSKPRVRQPQTTHKKTDSEMSIDGMLEGLPEDIPLEDMGLLEGKPRYMGAAVGGQVVVEFWGMEDDLQRTEMMVSTVGVSDENLRRNAGFVLKFVKNAIPQWQRDTDWVADFLQSLSSKDTGQGGFDTKSRTVRFLFVKPLGAVRVTIEKA